MPSNELSNCPICLDPIAPDVDSCRTMCRHEFHTSCLLRLHKNECPICRRKLRPINERRARRKRYLREQYLRREQRRAEHREQRATRREPVRWIELSYQRPDEMVILCMVLEDMWINPDVECEHKFCQLSTCCYCSDPRPHEAPGNSREPGVRRNADYCPSCQQVDIDVKRIQSVSVLSSTPL